MPSKARLLAKSMIESPILSEITTNPTVTPTTITTAVNDVATGNFASIDLLPNTGNDVGDQAFVQATNRLYIWSGSGWYNIALINTTPTWDSNGQPSATYELSADSPQTATTITLAASDPEGFPVSYNYITGGSMDSIATVSQDSSVFTITPKTSTQAPDGGTGSITFRASDGINILPQVSSFTLNFITIADDSKYTTLLATAVDTSDNNNITDASTNNHSITVNGDAHAGTFSPYRSGGYATSFSRSASSKLEIASMPAIGSGDCSIECWVKINSQAWNGIISRGAYTSSGTFSLSTRSGDSEITLVWNGSIYTTSGANININEWNWIQVVRSSGTITIYVNGISRKSVSNSANISSTSNYIIGRVDSSDYFGGQIRDLRISTNAQSSSSGSEKLETDSNTTFLSCHLPYLSYATSSVASNSYSSISGTIETVSNSPYDYDEYAVTDHSGSVYFDGSGDKLTIGGSVSDFNFGTNSFTIECWVYHQAAAVGPLFNTHRAGIGDGYYLALLSNGGVNWGNYVDGTGDISTSANVITQSTWNHISVNRDSSSSNSLKIYVNGILRYTGTSATDYNTFNYGPFVGGYDAGGAQYDFTGYLSDIIVVNGSVLRTGGTSVGDVAFTPPATPIATPSNTKLHIKGTDASIIDKSQGGNLELSGNVTGSTTQVKFAGSKSMYFPGSLGDQIIAISGENVDLSSTVPFTWEAWCYFNSVSGVIHILSSNDVGSPDRIAFELRNSKLSAMFGGTVIQSGSQVLSTGQWYHLAISRAVGSPYTTTRFFINGNLDQTAAGWQQAVAIGSFDKWFIGSPTTNNLDNGYNEFNGYMQDVRFTEGLTRYTANFTPPTALLQG